MVSIASEPPAEMSAKSWKFGLDTFVKIWRQCRAAMELTRIGLDREVAAIARMMFETAAVLEFVCLETIDLPFGKKQQQAVDSLAAGFTTEVRAKMCLLHNEYERVRFAEDLAKYPAISSVAPPLGDLASKEAIADLEKELGAELSNEIRNSKRFSLVGMRELASSLDDSMSSWYWLFYRQSSWSVHGVDMLSESEVSDDGKSIQVAFQSNSSALGTSLTNAADLLHMAMVPFSLTFVGEDAWEDVVELYERKR